MNLREAAQQALEALIWTTGSGDFSEGGQAREGALNLLFPAITALRAAFAEDAMQRLTDVQQEMDCYGDGNVYRGQRSSDSKTQTLTINGMPAVEGALSKAHRISQESRQVEDRAADTGKTYDTDDTPEQRMLRKKWFGGRLYGHLPFLEAVDETMKSLYDKLDEAKGTWKMLDNHFADVSKMVATIRPEVTVEPVAFVRRDYAHRICEVLTQADFNGDKAEFLKYCMADKNWLPLYTAPPKRKPLAERMEYEAKTLLSNESFKNAFCLGWQQAEHAHGIGGEE